MSTENQNEYVSVYLAEGQLEGEMVKAFLEAQGIPAMLSQEAVGKVYGMTVGDLGVVDVLVNQTNETRARELLQAMDAGDYANEILVSDEEPSQKVGPETQPDEAELKQRKRVLSCAPVTPPAARWPKL